ncbi:MAG: DUF1254 domain-containing protein [Alphaproteobacteria bacterium]|nr:DUF1254 domain-containing protein [Alphaproteobacteria bacterium]
MRRGIGLLLTVAGVAILVHFIVLALIPGRVMATALSRIGADGGVNQMIFPPLPDASSRGVIRPSPDLLYSVCAFDLSGGPVEISVPITKDAYASLALYSDVTDNFFVVNDTQAPFDSIEIVLVSGTERPQTDIPIIKSPSETGLALVRMLATSPEDAAKADAIRRTGSCRPFASPAPPEAMPAPPPPAPKPE